MHGTDQRQFGQKNNLTIEEAKNSEAEEDSHSNISPKGAGKLKLNHTISGSNEVSAGGSLNRDPKRESNGIGGLIKKVRGGS